MLRGKTVAAHNAQKTHCPQGHEFTPENTYRVGGARRCRECNRARCREHNQRRKAKARA